MAEVVKIFLVYIAGMVVRKNMEVKRAAVWRKGVSAGIVRIILLKSKGGIGKLKLTEVEWKAFDGDCRGGCMHK